jgi:hypothetical protein
MGANVVDQGGSLGGGATARDTEFRRVRERLVARERGGKESEKQLELWELTVFLSS